MTGFVVGDYEVRQGPGETLQFVEEHSRGGQTLSGTLRPTYDGWWNADLQQGHACRLRVRVKASTTPTGCPRSVASKHVDAGDPISRDRYSAVVVSQFREAGQEQWEVEMTSSRVVEHDGSVGGWLRARGHSAAASAAPASLGDLHVDALVAGGSLAFSVVCLTAAYGSALGLGMAALLLVHETGHALMMRRLGIECGPMVFLPFFGAAIEMRSAPTATQEGLIALAGPVVGSAAAALCWLAALSIGSASAPGSTEALLLYLAQWGFALNFLNLLPLGCLDGGRLTALFDPRLRAAGSGLAAIALVGGYSGPYIGNMSGVALLAGPPGVLTVALFGSCCWASRPWQPAPHRPALGGVRGLALALAYAGLTGALLVACDGRVPSWPAAASPLVAAGR